MMQNALCCRGILLLPPWRGKGLTALRRRSRAKVGMGGIVFSLLWLSLALAGEPQHAAQSQEEAAERVLDHVLLPVV